MNPVEHFEKSARKIWAADLAPEDKARRLLVLAEAVDKYVQKLDAKANQLISPGDQWAQRALARARAHLEQIARDAKDVGISLRQA